MLTIPVSVAQTFPFWMQLEIVVEPSGLRRMVWLVPVRSSWVVVKFVPVVTVYEETTLPWLSFCTVVVYGLPLDVVPVVVDVPDWSGGAAGVGFPYGSSTGTTAGTSKRPGYW